MWLARHMTERHVKNREKKRGYLLREKVTGAVDLWVPFDGARDGNPVCVAALVDGLGKNQVLKDRPWLRVALDVCCCCYCCWCCGYV